VSTAVPPQQSRLSPVTSGFVLAAAVTVLFNTALAWAKDMSAPLTAFMASLTGHHWTTHGLADLLLFVALGLFFVKTGIAEKVSSDRLPGVLIGAVVVAALGLVVWFAFV
jgi:hypothetical protein